MPPAVVRRFDYGPDPGQYAELSLPRGRPRGVVVVVHGGFWKSAYDLSLGRPIAADLVGRGWAVWNLEYRRVGSGRGGGGGVPQTLKDVEAGIDALGRTGLDLTTVVALGHSAGGHLAAWAGALPAVTAVVSQAGVLDLRAAHDAGLGGGAVERFLGRPPDDAHEDVDPIRRVPLAVPVWCVHGRADEDVPFAQSQAYVAAALAAGGTAELVEVEGDHYAVIDPASAAWARQLRILDGLS